MAYLEFDKGTIGTSFTETPIRCVIDISSINAAPPPTTPYKVGDTYYKNGIACGKIAKLDSTGKHGTVITSGAYVRTQSETSNYCINKSTCGLDWGIASPESIKTQWTSVAIFTHQRGAATFAAVNPIEFAELVVAQAGTVKLLFNENAI